MLTYTVSVQRYTCTIFSYLSYILKKVFILNKDLILNLLFSHEHLKILKINSKNKLCKTRFADVSVKAFHLVFLQFFLVICLQRCIIQFSIKFIRNSSFNPETKQNKINGNCLSDRENKSKLNWLNCLLLAQNFNALHLKKKM